MMPLFTTQSWMVAPSTGAQNSWTKSWQPWMPTEFLLQTSRLASCSRSMPASGNLAKAIEVFRTMPQKGQFVPNNTVWSCLLSACVSNNNADEAMKVFAKMQAASVMAESRACTALVQCLVRNDRLHEAIDVVDVVYGLRKGSNKPSNASIDQECLESLLPTLAQKGFLEELGAPLLQRLRAAKVSVAGRLMASALRMEGSQKSTCESTLLTSLGRGEERYQEE